MPSIYDWSTTAGTNANADSGINWAEGQPASTVNDSARTMMERIKRLVLDLGGSITTGGTANALTASASSQFTSYANGQILTIKATATNTGAATINVNSIGTKAIRAQGSTADIALVAGAIVSGGIYRLYYSTALDGGSGGWLLTNPSVSSSLAPTGALQAFAGSTAPADWLACYGQAVSRTTYAALFAAISTTWGSGDGSTTFNLPDLRGRVLAGKDDMGGSSANRLTGLSGGVNGDNLGATGGSETNTLSSSEIPSHTHSFSATTGSSGAHTHQVGGRDSDGGFGFNANIEFVTNYPGAGGNVTTSSDGAHTHTVSGTTGSTGSGGAHNNIQPTAIVLWCIKT